MSTPGGLKQAPPRLLPLLAQAQQVQVLLLPCQQRIQCKLGGQAPARSLESIRVRPEHPRLQWQYSTPSYIGTHISSSPKARHSSSRLVLVDDCRWPRIPSESRPVPFQSCNARLHGLQEALAIRTERRRALRDHLHVDAEHLRADARPRQGLQQLQGLRPSLAQLRGDGV